MDGSCGCGEMLVLLGWQVRQLSKQEEDPLTYTRSE